jgi:hydrogenase nickel incorporation protein HypA/HybF
MHEWALAESLVAAIEEELAKHPRARLRRMNLSFGELQSIDREVFMTAMDGLLTAIPHLEDCVHIVDEPARFHCNACPQEWTLDDSRRLSPAEREAIHFLPEAAYAYIRCPACGSKDYHLSAGRGIVLQSIELVNA